MSSLYKGVYSLMNIVFYYQRLYRFSRYQIHGFIPWPNYGTMAIIGFMPSYLAISHRAASSLKVVIAPSRQLVGWLSLFEVDLQVNLEVDFRVN